MISKPSLRIAATALGVLAALGAGPSSASTCFTGFGGTIHYQFTQNSSAFTSGGTRAVAGIEFGALSSCAGLARWPLIGAVQVDASGAVLGFRAMSVDATGCGAVDVIANLNTSTLSGPLQLHNDRTNFSNTSTLVLAPCVVPPLAAELATAATADGDEAGNR
jgi:hypothetical protein